MVANLGYTRDAVEVEPINLNDDLKFNDVRERWRRKMTGYKACVFVDASRGVLRATLNKSLARRAARAIAGTYSASP